MVKCLRQINSYNCRKCSKRSQARLNLSLEPSVAFSNSKRRRRARGRRVSWKFTIGSRSITDGRNWLKLRKNRLGYQARDLGKRPVFRTLFRTWNAHEHTACSINVNFVTSSISSFQSRLRGRCTTAHKRWTNPSIDGNCSRRTFGNHVDTLWSILRLGAFPAANYFGFVPESALVWLKACKQR